MHFNKLVVLTIIVALIGVMTYSLSAQNVKELENQRKQALQKLESTNKRLKETKQSKKNSLTKLAQINKNIIERKNLITNINGEIGELNDKMQRLQKEKSDLEEKLQKVKDNYARMIQNSYANRNMYSKMMFVLSANSFNQSFTRIRYVQECADAQKNQAREIERISNQIVLKNDSLNGHKTVKEEIVKQKVTETVKLSKDEAKEKELLSDLQEEEKRLRSELKIQQKKANELNSRIEAIIAEEIRKAEAKRAAEEARRQEAERKAAANAANNSSQKKAYTYNPKALLHPPIKPLKIIQTQALLQLQTKTRLHNL